MSKRKNKERVGNALPALTDSQLEIMNLVWARGESTVTDIWNALSRRRDVARNTILTVMDRLVTRGWLLKRRVGNTDVFEAAVEQDKTLGQMVKHFVDTAFSGAADQLVMALLEGRGVTDEEAARIKKLISDKRKRDSKRG